MEFLSSKIFDSLSRDAMKSLRKRVHKNIHQSHYEPCQRLLNVVHRESYFTPHAHSNSQGIESLVAVRGLMMFIRFDERGSIESIIPFGSELYSNLFGGVVNLVNVEPGSWHSLISISEYSVIFEAKNGPFIEDNAKILAPWAPPEGSSESLHFRKKLERLSECRYPELCVFATRQANNF